MNLVTVITKIVAEAPEDVTACEDIFEEVMGTFNWIMHHLSPAQMISNIIGNLTTHMVVFTKDIWGMFSALL